MPEEGQTGKDSQSGATAGNRTFTAEEVEATVAERVARERGRCADYDDLKKAAAKLREMESGGSTEIQRL